jgi:hypothetical protein
VDISGSPKEAMVDLFEALRFSSSSPVGLCTWGLSDMNTDGTRGRDGTEDLRLCLETVPGGAGKRSWIFSSKVMLLVSFGRRRVNLDALVGGGGRGGSFVGLPGLDIKHDFRTIIDGPDLLRLCPGDGSLGNRALGSSVLRL